MNYNLQSACTKHERYWRDECGTTNKELDLGISPPSNIEFANAETHIGIGAVQLALEL